MTGFIARMFRVVQRPARSTTNDDGADTTGELSSMEFTSRCSTQTSQPGEAVVHISGEPSSLPTTPAPAYTTHATFSLSTEYGPMFQAGMFPEPVIPEYNDVLPRSMSVPRPTRRGIRSLVRWGGRSVTNDVEMQLPVQIHERPPTYVEVDAPVLSQVAPRRRGWLKMLLLLVVSALIACVITIAFMKKAHAF